MSTKSNVLKILLANQQAAISGEKMAMTLSVSRTAIWKAINELKKEGHTITSATNRGYQYVSNDTLSEEDIRFHLSPLVPPLQIEITETLASTNQTLKKAAIDGAPTNTLLLAKQQTETKGRFGRQFFASQNNQGIYLSLLLHTNQPFEEVAQYTLMTAVALSQAIESIQTEPVSIKWVNDLYMDEKKVCGILSEAITDFETQTISSVIIGVGINFSIPQTEFPEDIRHRATSIFPDGQSTASRNKLIAHFLNTFYGILNQSDPSIYLEEYRKRSFVLGREVSFTYNRQEYSGIATAITDIGELVVSLGHGETLTLRSGEISLTSY